MNIKRALVIFALLILILAFTYFALFSSDLHLKNEGIYLAIAQASDRESIEQSIHQAISAQKEDVPLLQMYDTQIDEIRISEDGNWATAWIIPVDPDTGNVVPAEPGLVIVRKEGDSWHAFLPNDPLWTQALQQTPDDLIPPSERDSWILVAMVKPSAAPETPLKGYHLPWEGGQTMSLTQSVGHDRYTPSGSAHYAFDFAKPGYPSGLFNILAAKGGRVKQAVWRYPNGDPSHSNYIVLEDTTTNPTTYQLYLHLAQNSIPEKLRTVGAYAAKGQFIGIADDTGVSSGNHLHFHVHTNPFSYWGNSVDIIFKDVSINGGRPRIKTDLPYCKSTDVCDTTQTSYTSGNSLAPDKTPPIGDIVNPPHSASITTNPLHLAGWATDEQSGLESARFKAYYNNNWYKIGEKFSTETFIYPWNLCTDNVINGPVSLALNIKDKAGNKAGGLPGLTHFLNNLICPSNPKTCVPNSNQVALFSGIDFEGTCVVLDTGSFPSHTSLGNLGGDNASSMLVGDEVKATLFMNSELKGRRETFTYNDRNLSDNLIGINTTSSVTVKTRSASPSTPILVWPESDAIFMDNGSLSFTWRDGGGASQFQARLLLNDNEIAISPWQQHTFWHINTLQAGNYSWQVRSRYESAESNWSSPRPVKIKHDTTNFPSTVNLPFNDNMESSAPGWTQSGQWKITSHLNHTPGGSKSWRYQPGNYDTYDNGKPNGGYLTSPPIDIPNENKYYLRFWYLYQTEGWFVNWDQRWVQISVDGEKFTNLFQLVDDNPKTWLRSPAVPLDSYSGHKIQVRFYFVTLDRVANNYLGWFIDDFSIKTDPPPDCTPTNNSILQATQINLYDSVEGVICPGADVDYYQFQGTEGDRIAAWTEAQVINSPLDTYLFLYDEDGRSILAKNNDIQEIQQTDSLIDYRISRTGLYYLKVRSFDHPTSGGEDYTYTLKLVKDNEPPITWFIQPKDGDILPAQWPMLKVEANDGQSGVNHVTFFWHSSNWIDSKWKFIGEDWNGHDGWSYLFNPSKVKNPTEVAFYAKVFDRAGNSKTTGVWNIRLVSVFMPLILR